MFCEDIPRFANLFGITTNVEISDRVPLFTFLLNDITNLLLTNVGGPRGTEEYREGNSIYRYRFGTSFRLKRRNSEKDTQLTNKSGIYPHKSLVYMLLRYNYR